MLFASGRSGQYLGFQEPGSELSGSGSGSGSGSRARELGVGGRESECWGLLAG